MKQLILIFIAILTINIQSESIETKKLIQTNNQEDDTYIELIFPPDKTITDLTYLQFRGRASEMVDKITIEGRDCLINQDKIFNCRYDFKNFGKNKIILKAFLKNGQAIEIPRRAFQRALFVDVKSNSIAAEAIYRMSELRFFSGYSDISFQPQKPLKREELATILSKIKNLKIIKQNSNPASDVPKNSWAAPYIDAVIKNDIMPTFKDGSFKPQDYISKLDVLAIIAKFDNLKIEEQVILHQSFYDLPIDSKYAKYAEALKKAGIIRSHTLKPEEYFTRQEAAKWLYNTKEIEKYLINLNNWQEGF